MGGELLKWFYDFIHLGSEDRTIVNIDLENREDIFYASHNVT